MNATSPQGSKLQMENGGTEYSIQLNKPKPEPALQIDGWLSDLHLAFISQHFLSSFI